MERLSEGRGRREKCTTGATASASPERAEAEAGPRPRGRGRSGVGRGQSLGAGPGRLLRALYGVSRAWAGAGSLDGQEPRVARFLARWGSVGRRGETLQRLRAIAAGLAWYLRRHVQFR